MFSFPIKINQNINPKNLKMSKSKKKISTFSMFFIFLILLLVFIFSIFHDSQSIFSKSIQSFSIDYENDTFLMHGKPFRFISGEFHYFRTPQNKWLNIIRKIKAAGLNAISTYVEWSFHEELPGVFNFNDDRNLEYFLQLIQSEKLYVLLRLGPFICGERNFGGLPPWLYTIKPDIILRQNDPTYQYYVAKWFEQLLPRIQKYLHGNGGPIILIQVENEYSMYKNCDPNHMVWLRDLIKYYVKDNAILYSIDPPHKQYLRCSIDEVYTTVDFGPYQNPKRGFKGQRIKSPHGPLVNSEYYTGWLTHWTEPTMQTAPVHRVINSLKEMLDMNANVNIYMFFGGTNYGFTSGANMDRIEGYLPTITSYDYDSPLNEAGDPTEKYYAIRDLIREYVQLPFDVEVPKVSPKGNYGTVILQPIASIFDENVRPEPIVSNETLTFEQLRNYNGFVLYETIVPEIECTKCSFVIPKIRDRVDIFVNEKLNGIIYRNDRTNFHLNEISKNSKLSLFVENMGRINHNQIYDPKGILSDVLLDSELFPSWNIFPFPFDDISKVQSLQPLPAIAGAAERYPSYFTGTFEIQNELLDTYLDLSKWNKGIVFINNYNIGRYWSAQGPQYTLFVPLEYLKKGMNWITIFEQYKAPKDMSIAFVTQSLNKVVIEEEDDEDKK